MKCPGCGHLRSRTVDSRAIEHNSATRRRRECLQCHGRFTTYERMFTTLNKPLPQYRCHKVVGAVKIKELSPTGVLGGWLIVPEEAGHDTLHVTSEWFVKFSPEIGGYFVVYEDGYSSYSPAAAFEAGYTRIEKT